MTEIKTNKSFRTTTRKANRGADLFARALRFQGVEQITGLTGGAIMEGMDALHSDPGLRILFSQTEEGAAWAAMGYARTSGRVGVCVVTSGPAATNTVTPIADAHRDNVPLVVITGQVPTSARNTDAFQETNITEIARPTAKEVFYLNRAEDIPEVVSEAFRIAREGRPGPVLIDLTKDAQQEVVDVESDLLPHQTQPLSTLSSESGHKLPEEDLDGVARCLREAKRPVIIAGYGVVLAGVQQDLQRLLAISSCPVVHTLPGKASLPTAHPLNFGMLGMHGFYLANWMVHYSDLIVSLGSRYDDRITGNTEKFAPGARKLVHFDIDSEQIRKVLPRRKLGVLGDLRETLPALNHRLQDTEFDLSSWHDELVQIGHEFPSTYKRKQGQLQAQYVLETLNRLLEEDSSDSGRQVIFTTEVGDHQMWAGQFLNLKEGWQFLTSSGQGAMGSGLPMAIGAQLANPDHLVICLAGDGSLRMSEAELETIAEYRLPIKILVLNNHGYGIVRMWNHLFYEGRETGVVKTNKNWRLLAVANGFTEESARQVTTEKELDDSLRQAIASEGPCFLELLTPYEECLPLMPPGKSFTDMIL